MEESKKIELVYEAIQHAKSIIALVYKPKGAVCGYDGDIQDPKIKKYYLDLNTMLIELCERNSMDWQKEDSDEN